MSLLRSLQKAIYPFIMRLSKSSSKGKVLENKQKSAPRVPIFESKVNLNNGTSLDLGQWKGKKVLLVNTASNCGFTGQYEELQKLYEQEKGALEIIGFPANDFKEQEKADDAQISQFCQINFGVNFPLAKKSSVVKGAQQNPIYTWLTNASQNGWNDHQPDWNFSKYLLDEQGRLTHYFGPAVSPLGPEIAKAVHSK